VPRTCVFFHAHRDDEALLTAGTMARLAAEGHRVVLVAAATGREPSCLGLDARPPAPPRTDVLDAPARMLGCARVVLLGYEDSGPAGNALGGFARTNVDLAAEVLAEVLREEDAELLTVHDPMGGYGHPDHVQVHRAGLRAAELAGTPVVLEATLDRDLLRRALRLGLLPRARTRDLRMDGYASQWEITHRVSVGAHLGVKRAVMRAHAAQRVPGDSVCASTALARLPRAVFGHVMGTEWFIRRDLPPGHVLRNPLDAWPGAAVANPAPVHA
jgi:LmbE family N-acetylglucosaminyl deacetylase